MAKENWQIPHPLIYTLSKYTTGTEYEVRIKSRKAKYKIQITGKESSSSSNNKSTYPSRTLQINRAISNVGF